MTQDVTTALASWFDQYEVCRQLHDVPPHAVFEVTVDGRRAVCKVARGETADVGAEAAVLDHADRHTDLPVPTVLAAREEAFVATWLDELADDVDRDDSGDARALGTGLARLHAATADQFARPGFPRLGRPWGPDDPSFDDGAGEKADRAGLVVDARDDWHVVALELVTECRSYLAGIGWADPADEVLALLEDCPALFDGAGTPVLCHGNFHPEHTALRDTADPALAALVDFEHALVAPAEYDYWRTAIPVFHTTDLERRATYEAFRAGYESVRPLPLGIERRADAWWAVITVTFLVALDVQNGGIGPAERERAEGTAGLIAELATTARERARDA